MIPKWVFCLKRVKVLFSKGLLTLTAKGGKNENDSIASPKSIPSPHKARFLKMRFRY